MQNGYRIYTPSLYVYILENVILTNDHYKNMKRIKNRIINENCGLFCIRKIKIIFQLFSLKDNTLSIESWDKHSTNQMLALKCSLNSVQWNCRQAYERGVEKWMLALDVYGKEMIFFLSLLVQTFLKGWLMFRSCSIYTKVKDNEKSKSAKFFMQ